MAKIERTTSGDEGVRLDAEGLRALAHPLRSRLVTELRREGPATATDLAAALGTNTGATSYHLRRLESVGLVTDTGEGEGRRRLWKAATRFHSWYMSDFAEDEDAEVALSWLVRNYLRQLTQRHEHWLDVESSWPLAWRDAAGLSDDSVLVTAAQLAQLRDEVGDVVARYREAGKGFPDAERVSANLVLHPIDLDRETLEQGS